VLFYFENHKENCIWEILRVWENFGQGAFSSGVCLGGPDFNNKTDKTAKRQNFEKDKCQKLKVKKVLISSLFPF
jgi:hypothetical protein